MSKIPQEAVRKNCQLVIDDLAERFSNGSPTANDYVDYMGRIVDVAIHSFEAADAARAQGAEVEPVAFQRQETDGQWANDFSKDPDMQEYWRSWQ